MREQFREANFRNSTLKRIDQANGIIALYRQQGYTLTLRQLYYQMVARALIENSIRSYKNFGDTISNARYAGLVDWDMIEDRARRTVKGNTWKSGRSILGDAARQYRIDKWEGQEYHVEVFAEKDAVSNIIEPVCLRNDVAFTANRGYASSSLYYEISKRLDRIINNGKAVHLIYVGDHDPSGIDMRRDLAERLEEFLAGRDFTLARVALNMDQVEAYEMPENPAKETDSRYASYVREFGESSWELDALEPAVLETVIEGEIITHRDKKLWDDRVAYENAQRASLAEYVKGYVDIDPQTLQKPAKPPRRRRGSQ